MLRHVSSFSCVCCVSPAMIASSHFRVDYDIVQIENSVKEWTNLLVASFERMLPIFIEKSEHGQLHSLRPTGSGSQLSWSDECFLSR